MDLIIKIAGLAVISAIITVLLKKNVPEISLMLAIAAVCIVIGALTAVLKGVGDFIDSVWNLSGISAAVLSPLLKTVCVSIICKLGSDVCKDASQNALASAVEFSGVVVSIYIALPLMRAAVDMLVNLSGE